MEQAKELKPLKKNARETGVCRRRPCGKVLRQVQEERGHVIASLTKRGKISRVSCPKCGTLGTFKTGAASGHKTQT